MGLRDRAPYDGALIAICGLDGSGKTTQVKLLAESLSAVASVSVFRPVTDAFRNDPTVTAYLDGTMPADQRHDMVAELALLAAADGFRQMRTAILPRLQAGDVVLCDRYIYSAFARTLARGFEDQDWLSRLYRYMPVPDLTLFLDIPPEKALERIRSRGSAPRWEEADPAKTAAARAAFLEQPWGRQDTYRIIDAERSVDELAAAVRQVVTETLRLPIDAGTAASPR
ncbi:dTMP kinase [Catellatospora sp. NEAU-YM18]|nr:dTMP kinase [Catellatospora tritici]